MKLAWQNIIHDRARFSVTVLGVSFAVFLMVFQGSLLVGFLRAASRLIDASDSDIWITARGVQAFEFGTPIEGRVTAMPAEGEVNRHRASIERQIEGYGAFLGVPFLFTSYRNASRYMGVGPEEAMFVLLRVDKGYSTSDVQQNLRQRLPEVDVLTRDEFARKSRTYWTIKTGAGGAILTAAVLGFLIGLVVVSQTIYANTMENIEEYATLKALGASQAFVARIVLTQALICGAVGSVLGLLAVVPSIGYAKSLIPWIYTPWWLLLVMVMPSLAMCSLASIASVRSALTVEPGRVFRA